jgi:hypothetical protein
LSFGTGHIDITAANGYIIGLIRGLNALDNDRIGRIMNINR